MKEHKNILPAADPLSQKKITVLDVKENEIKQRVFRMSSLEKYKTERYILRKSPKPVSRILTHFKD